MKNCHNCGAPLDDDALFCTNCGKKIEPEGKKCPQCGAEVEDDSVFCFKCGTRLDEQVVPYIDSPQIVTPVNPPQEKEEVLYDWEKEEKIRKWKTILWSFVLVVILALVGYYIYMNYNKNGSNSTIKTEREPIALKGSINETIGFSMKLHFNGNEVEGSERYDNQKAGDTISIKGTIDENSYLILHEYDKAVECGKFEGFLHEISYSGTFTNSRGKEMSFSAKVLSEKDLAKEKEAINEINKKGTIIANVDGKIYYLDKGKPQYEYDENGDNCAKLYIYNIADGITSYVIIWSIDDGGIYAIENCKYRDMKITFVMYNTSRKGAGIGNFCTDVRQYNIKTGKWKTIAEECAKAVFMDNNRKIKITIAEIINPDAFAYEYEYKYSDIIIDL